MRISIDDNDVGYINFLALKEEYNIYVKFDDQHIMGAITADEEQGHLKYYHVVDGKHVFTDGVCLTAETKGKVEILLISKPTYDSENPHTTIH